MPSIATPWLIPMVSCGRSHARCQRNGSPTVYDRTRTIRDADAATLSTNGDKIDAPTPAAPERSSSASSQPGWLPDHCSLPGDQTRWEPPWVSW